MTVGFTIHNASASLRLAAEDQQRELAKLKRRVAFLERVLEQLLAQHPELFNKDLPTA